MAFCNASYASALLSNGRIMRYESSATAAMPDVRSIFFDMASISGPLPGITASTPSLSQTSNRAFRYAGSSPRGNKRNASALCLRTSLSFASAQTMRMFSGAPRRLSIIPVPPSPPQPVSRTQTSGGMAR